MRSTGGFFFIRTIFLLERISDKLWLFTVGHLTDIFVKMNRLSQMVIVVSDKIQVLKLRLDFSKTCVSTWEPACFLVLKRLSWWNWWWLLVNRKLYYFLFNLEALDNLENQYLRMISVWCYKINHGRRPTQKVR